jgi:hypothetical protein
MTATAVLSIFFGSVGILNGVYLLLGAVVMLYELLRFGIFMIPMARFAFAFLILGTGIVGLIAGVGVLRLRSWARPLSLVYAGLLIFSCVCSFFSLSIISTIGTYDIRTVNGYDLARLIVFSVVHILIPLSYSLLLTIVFYRPGWKAAFAKARIA